MRIVLHEVVKGLGNRGDLVDVSDGYARNFLIPKGMAQLASAGVEQQADSMRKAWSMKNAKDREAAEEVAKVLVTAVVSIPARAGGEGKLFGSVTAADVATAIAAQTGVELDRKMIALDDAIRTVGTHSVTVQLHPEVQFPVSVDVVAG
ncbi:MAG: large subunit ribosomal protein L9 [Acidimicrobiales bacterium]|jgi:large subunit ribosomal protein L9